MSYAVVTLEKGEGRTLKAGGAWVLSRSAGGNLEV